MAHTGYCDACGAPEVLIELGPCAVCQRCEPAERAALDGKETPMNSDEILAKLEADGILTVVAEHKSCTCTPESRCPEAEGYWSAANAVYYSQGYDAWQKALEPYNEHIARTGEQEAQG